MFDVENFEKVMRQNGSFYARSKDSIEVDGHHISSHILVKKVYVNGSDEYYLTRYNEDDESGRKFYVDKYIYHIANGKFKCISCEKDYIDDYIPCFHGYFNLEAILLSCQIAMYLIHKTNATSLGCCDIYCEARKYIQNYN